METIHYREIEGKIDLNTSAWGSSAKTFPMNNEFQGYVYKNYLRPVLLTQRTSRNISYLEHLENLSKIEAKEMMSLKMVVVNPIAILGVIMKKAPGKLLANQNIGIIDLLSANNHIREAILDISTHFQIFDLNEGSIFFSAKEGTTLVDLESYLESPFNHAHQNLYAFYSKVAELLNYRPDLLELILDEMKKSADRCRFEVIYDIVSSYLKKHQLEEKDVKVYKKRI